MMFTFSQLGTQLHFNSQTATFKKQQIKVLKG